MTTAGAGRRNHLLFMCAAITVLIVCAGSALAAANAAAATVKIGVVLPLTGSSASMGQAAEHGAQLAVQQANSGKLVPGVTFTLVARSDTGTAGTPDGATGASQIKGLIGNGRVAGVVAPFDTPTALGELPLTNRAPLATVSPFASDTCLTVTGALGCTGNASELATVQPTGRTTFFRVVPADALQSASLADFLFNSKFFRKAYVIDDGAPAGTARSTTFVNRWQLDGGTILGHASTPPTSTSFVNLLTQISAVQPDVIVYTGQDGAEGFTLRKQMVTIPALKNTAFAGTSAVHTTDFIQAVGPTGGPVWAVAPAPQLPSGTTFATQYQAEFGTPSTDAARGYDSAQALLLGVRAAIAGGARPPASAGSTATGFRSAVIAAVARDIFKGATGPIAFAPDGDLQQGPIEIDQLTTVGTLSWTSAATVQVSEPAPTATLTPSPPAFGWVPVGSSTKLTVELSNTGTVPFGVALVSVSGSGFTLAGTTCTTANLQPSAQCGITISFAPGTAGTLTGHLTVVDTAGGPLQTTTLSGTGIKALALPAAVYVGNGASSSVRSFTLPLGGNQTPATILAGPNTQLNGTGAVALDKFGDLYVANADSESITVYPGNATGDTKPLGVISGADTGIANPTAITLDAQGRLYVSNAAAGTVTVYAPGANNDAAPIRTISGLTSPDGLVVDSAGNLWVANLFAKSLERFGPTDTKPAATISGPTTELNGPQSLTLDRDGNVVVADEFANAVTAYRASDNGDVPPRYSISGPATGLNFPVGLDIDANGNLYVSNMSGDSITVYGATARGNTPPLATVKGSATGLAAPQHLAVSPPLAILTDTLPAAHAGRPYRVQLTAAFGVGRYHWSIRSGRLPQGLRLNTRTGVLAGTPRRTGTVRFRIKVTDTARRANTATRLVTVIVKSAAR